MLDTRTAVIGSDNSRRSKPLLIIVIIAIMEPSPVWKRGTRYWVLGTKCEVLGTRYEVLGTRIRIC